MDQGHVISLNPIWLPVDGFFVWECLLIGVTNVFGLIYVILIYKKTLILTLKSTEISSPYPPTTLKMKRTENIYKNTPVGPCHAQAVK